MTNFDRLASELSERLDLVLSDTAEALAEANNGLTVDRAVGVASVIPVVIAEVRRFFADQVSPPGPCLRPGCGHPSDWHRLDDAQNVGPTDPAALYRCLGYDVHAPGPPQRRCDCPDYVRQPDPVPQMWIGGWPSACGACGHRHTPGERCADHVWQDGCPYNAGRYCRRPELLPDNVPPCGIVGHVGCTWQHCTDRYTTAPEASPVRLAHRFDALTWFGNDRPSRGIWWGFQDPSEQPRQYLGISCTITRDGHQVVVRFVDEHVIRFGVQRKFRLQNGES